MTKAQIGTISHGTMRNEDLIETFSDELKRHTRENGSTQAYWDLFKACNRWLTVNLEKDWIDENEQELGSELVHDLFDALNDFAPPYCYFGANEGDGSDYGFWPCIDQIEEDCQSGELVKFDAGDKPPEGVECVAVNDHGNVTFYNADGTVAWDCV